MSNNVKRRPKGKSSWETSDMKQNALIKFGFYRAELSQDENKMIDWQPCEPFARYSLKGQTLAVTEGRQTLDWLIIEMRKRLLFNPAYSTWHFCVVYQNTGTGNFKPIRYYERVINAGEMRFVSPEMWPMATRKIYQILKTQVQ